MLFVAASMSTVIERWCTHTSAEGLTWGVTLNGYALLAAIARHVPIGGTEVLEIGPGYGRLLDALAECKIAPHSYLGLDLSEHWTRELRRRHGSNRIRFLVGDVCSPPQIAGKFDLVVGFLTFKHIRPDFSAAAQLAAHVLRRGHGRLIFDLPETDTAWPAVVEPADHIEGETGTFTRSYRRDELSSILRSSGLTVVAFDDLYHTPEKRRLLVVAKKT